MIADLLVGLVFACDLTLLVLFVTRGVVYMLVCVFGCVC